MKVLLTRPITYSSNSWYFPSGLGYIARYISDAGHEIKVFDPEVEGGDLNKHCEFIKNEKYDVLGISALINKYEYVKKLAESSKQYHPHSKVILGGNITGPIWELLLNNTNIDVVVFGEGEETVVEILKAFENGLGLEGVKGIAFNLNGKPFHTELRSPIISLDEIPFPAYEYFPMEKYLTTPGKLSRQGLGKRDLSMITSRGCPYSCTFCYRPEWEKVRHRSVENVLREIRYLIDSYNLDALTFNDELTLWSKKNAYKLCDVLETTGIYWGCVGRINIVDENLLKRMYETGCRWITYGIESGSETILREMKKNAKVEKAKQAVIWTKKAGIGTNPTFIIGYPSETRETAMESVDFMKATGLHPDSLFFATPYPGTKLYNDAVKNGRITDSIEEYLHKIDGEDAHSLLVNLTQMSDEELLALRDEVLRKVKPTSWDLFKKAVEILKQKGWKTLLKKITGKLKLVFSGT
ncbi:MAG: B12-binding domain-containing radical SAM protein [Nitrospinota bacterium]